MLSGTHFYNKTVRKSVAVFGTLFNNIKILRPGATEEKVQVAYGPRKKFLARIESDTSGSTAETIAIKLPRISFEITSMEYDNESKLNRFNKKFIPIEGDTDNVNTLYQSVPYIIGMQLNVYALNQDEALQIVEQILPYFQPDYTVTVNMVPNLDIKRDIPIVLGNINYEDSYDGEFTNRRAVIYTINFTAKTYLFGPMNNQGVIKKTQADLGADTDPQLTREERVVILPDPTTAEADDDFGFTTTISFFEDGKRFDPTSGDDT